MDVDHHSSSDLCGQPRALDLVRLEDPVAVREDRSRREPPHLLDRLERALEQPLVEGIGEQPGRERPDAWISQVLETEALERSEVVGIAHLAAQLLVVLAIATPALLTEAGHDLSVEIDLETVVVEQGVVDVEEDDDLALGAHRDPVVAVTTASLDPRPAGRFRPMAARSEW